MGVKANALRQERTRIQKWPIPLISGEKPGIWIRTCELHTLKLMEKLDQKHGFNAFVKCLQVVKLDDCRSAQGPRGVRVLEPNKMSRREHPSTWIIHILINFLNMKTFVHADVSLVL